MDDGTTLPVIISTHTLARRVTLNFEFWKRPLDLFQPTPSHGG